MNPEELKERFLEILTPPLPSDWEAEENLAPVADLPESRQDLILRQVGAIWPVSNSLCYSYLACADKALSCLNVEQVSGWVAALLDIYEKEGLKAAQAFMADVESNYLCLLRGETGVRLADVAPRLLPYAKSILKILESFEKAGEVFTDTASIYLPGKLAIFAGEAENFLLYKLIISSQLSLIRGGTCLASIDPAALPAGKLPTGTLSGSITARLELEELWNLFPDPRLAEDIFTLAEGWRVSRDLAANFPGLWRDCHDLRQDLVKRRPPLTAMPEKSRMVEILSRYLISGRIPPGHGLDEDRLHPVIGRFDQPAESAGESAAKLISLHELLSPIHGPYEPVEPVFYLGRLKPVQARRVRMRKRAESRDKFIKALAAILPDRAGPDSKEKEESEPGGRRARVESEEAVALLINRTAAEDETSAAAETEEEREPGRHIILEGPEVELSAELKELSSEIRADLGQVPEEYISAAFGLAGRGAPPPAGAAEGDGVGLAASVTYDEWDYRRRGFRKKWCILKEKRVLPVKGTFVGHTLEKYRGLLIKLKKQFEMLRCTERLLKRQRDGDDIDLDAVIESISDLRAGRPESEKLFVRLRRDERDIAVLFLIDMSASTEGWVGDALKEALILMGEALEVLGDRYAVAGFSGMRRTRSDFYHIKDFAENYTEEIKGRIAGIAPREYTRMGPPIRHAAKILGEVDARVKLLIVLSDGKPEDYDDYKGDYAIEDTRHALIEAKAADIHPFCITIDQQAHDYNAHMYGEVNYIFLDKVENLPIRMPAIYRNLTT
ncbi:MAG: VWA domain-containing protein [Desulfurivibrionaceae bacterium]